MQFTLRFPQPTIVCTVLIGEGLLQTPQQWLDQIMPHAAVALITDDTVRGHYADQLLDSLQQHCQVRARLFSFPAGEQAKNYSLAQRLAQAILAAHYGRDTLILALGGGVVGDVAGFIAATYMRGIAYIALPTTLLAMVDSSIGGKTGVNLPQGKNAIGAFWHPHRVVMDLCCLRTLPRQQLINGLIEIVKIFLTHDHASFKHLTRHIPVILQGDLSALPPIIQQAVKLKSDLVQQDEREQGVRSTLNVGHTVGHAIEQVTQYTILHGYAVALGLLVELKVACWLCHFPEQAYQTVQQLLAELGIVGQQLRRILKLHSLDAVIQAMQVDKKARKRVVQYVLLANIGQPYQVQQQFLHVVDVTVIKRAMQVVSEEPIYQRAGNRRADNSRQVAERCGDTVF